MDDILNDNENIKFVLDVKDTRVLTLLLDKLRSDLLVGVETGYVDSMFRDEYYNYFGTKLHSYGRNCIKISFFLDKDKQGIDYYATSIKTEEEEAERMVNYSKRQLLKDNFMGFAIIRPTMACLGRNVISPEAFKVFEDDKELNYETCQVSIRISALGLEVKAKGFPHCTQDREMMSCAETTLWAIAEYFGHKYSRYRSVLPSDILEALRLSYNHRMLPSTGLTFDQISHGLLAFGFSPLSYPLEKSTDSSKIKSKKNSKYVIDDEYKEIFTCYVESGFPLALCLQGERYVKKVNGNELDDEGNPDKIIHAAVCIGRKRINVEALRKQKVNGTTINVWNRSIQDFVISDDNEPCYKIATLEHLYNEESEWKKVQITNFIVPLPSRVYMDAFYAIQASKRVFCTLLNYLIKEKIKIQNPTIRTFLASGRSFRKHIICSEDLKDEWKECILNLDLPHFIWISEIGEQRDFKNRVIKGLIIIDATESPKIKNESSQCNSDTQKAKSAQRVPYLDSDILLILSCYMGKAIAYNAESHSLEPINITSDFELKMYDENIHPSTYKSE